MPHSHPQFADLKTGPSEQENDLRFGVILGIPMCKCENHFTIGGAKPAGAVGQVHADEDSDDPAQHEAAELSDERLLVASLLEKP